MKKRIILISISFVLVILSLFLLVTKINNKINVEEFDNEITTKKENPTTNSKDPITFKDIDNNKQKEEKKYNNTNSSTSTNNNTNKNSNKNNNNTNIKNNSTNNNPTSVTPPTQSVTYSCPDGFELQGQECIQNIDATATCPNNMINIDPGCIIFSEKVESSDGNTCPDGYYGLTEIHIDGTPDEFYCHPIHNKIYTCPDGFNLNNTNCTKQVPATKN